MRRLIREILLSIAINTLILRGLSQIHFGMDIVIHTEGQRFPQLQTYIMLGLFLRIINCILRQIIQFFATPLKYLTFGLIGTLINIGTLYFFQRFINTNYGDQATIILATDYLRVLILSIVITVAYRILSQILK